jgi:hypothetical protein
VPGGEALHQHRQRRAVVDAVGDVDRQVRMDSGPRRVAPAAAGQRRDPAAVGGAAHHLAARDVRQGLRLGVLARHLLDVGEVHARGGDVQQEPVAVGGGIVPLHQVEHLGAAEAVELYGTHGFSFMSSRP